MSENQDDNRDPKLDRLVRLSREPAPGSKKLPDESTVEAYLLGKASRKQIEEVHRAMRISASFRSAMKRRVEDLEHLDALDASPQTASDSLVQVPERSEFLKRFESDRYSKPRLDTVSVLDRLRSLINVRVVVPALAAAAALILVVSQPGLWKPSESETGWTVVDESVEPALLYYSGDSRDALSADTLGFATAKEAALHAFSQMVEFRDGDWRPKPSDSLTTATEDNAKPITLTLTDDSGKLIATYTAYVPDYVDPEKNELTAWILSLPERRLVSSPVQADHVAEVPVLTNSGSVVLVVTGCVNQAHYAYSLKAGAYGK